MALGNPALLVAAKVGQGAKKILSNKKVQLVLAVLIGVFLLKGGFTKIRAAIRKGRFRKKSTEDPNRVALQFRNAANPSGVEFLIDVDGTSVDAMEKVARKMKNQNIIKEVSDAYRLAYDGETLQERAGKELNTSELEKFEDIIS